ncbi:hypothetical protein Tco_0277625 [Tanacetum coccineum]
MEEERTNGNELKTELKRIHTQIIKLQKKRLGQKDKIAFAHYRISDLEQIIEKIQAQMPPKRTSTSETPAITLAAIQQLIMIHFLFLSSQATSSIMSSLAVNLSTSMVRKEQLASFAGLSGTRINIFLRSLTVPKKTVFSRSKCAEEDRVTFATGTLTDDALSWRNAHAQPMGIEQANQIT